MVWSVSSLCLTARLSLGSRLVSCASAQVVSRKMRYDWMLYAAPQRYFLWQTLLVVYPAEPRAEKPETVILYTFFEVCYEYQVQVEFVFVASDYATTTGFGRLIVSIPPAESESTTQQQCTGHWESHRGIDITNLTFFFC